jgi:hypothetical protein
MMRSVPRRPILLKTLLTTAAAVALAFAPSAAWAQHGGGGGSFGGGGHSGGGHFGGGHVSAPHMAAPPAHYSAPPMRSAPAMRASGPRAGRMAGPPPMGAGTRSFGPGAGVPSVHFSERAGEPRPVLGNHVADPIMITPPHFANPSQFVPPPHTVIGFPPSERSQWRVIGGTPMSFSGQGSDIWQNSRGSTARIRPTGPTAAGARTTYPAFLQTRPGAVSILPEHRYPRRPVYPVNPGRPLPPGRTTFSGPVIFGSPFFGFGFGSPYLGFGGLYGGFGGLWGPGCGPYWAWGFGCNSLPFYSYGLGYDNFGYDNSGAYEAPNYGPDQYSQQEQPPAQPDYGPFIYEEPSGQQRALPELILKDGTVYDVTDYWLEGGDLHFTTPNADNSGTTEQIIDFDQLDLQKTVDVNTQNGFRFVLRNEPMQEYLQDQNQDQQNPQENPAPPAQPEQPPQPAQPPAPSAPPGPQI